MNTTTIEAIDAKEAGEHISDDLQALIAAITPENQHREIDSGPPVGEEAC